MTIAAQLKLFREAPFECCVHDPLFDKQVERHEIQLHLHSSAVLSSPAMLAHTSRWSPSSMVRVFLLSTRVHQANAQYVRIALMMTQ